MKARASLGWTKLPIPAKMEKGRNILSLVESNPSFKNCIPPVAELSALLDELATAHQQALASGLPAHTVILHRKEELVDNAFSRLVNYVEIVANGDESVILSAGIGVKAKTMRTQRYFMAKRGEHEGEAILETVVSGSGSYIWQKRAILSAADLASEVWELAGASTTARITVRGLVAGVKYLFRVSNVTTKGQGPWSEPVSLIAY